MGKVKLTAGRIEAFACPNDKYQAFLWDSDTSGLAVRATAGAKAYIFQGRLNGKSMRITIGDVKAWSLEEYRHPKTGEVITPGARQEARRLQTLIDQGRDPREVKAEITAADVSKRAAERMLRVTAIEAWRAYVDARAPKWGRRHKADHEEMSQAGGLPKKARGAKRGKPTLTQPGILRPLLELPLTGITRDTVAAWADKEAQSRPARARLALSLLNAFLTWCGDNPEYRDQTHADACARLKRELPKPQAHDDCLQREQLAPWFDSVGKLSNKTQSVYLQCLLLLGCRKNELASLQWGDVDFQWDSMSIRDKVEGERTIPLTPYVKNLLLSIKPAPVSAFHGTQTRQASPWVFAANSQAGYIQAPTRAHNKAIQDAGLPALTIHGLRRSFGTLAEWVECPAGVVAQIQGHKPSAIAEKHYRRRPLDLLRVWHTKIECWMLKEAGIMQPSTETAKSSVAIAI